MHDRYIEGLRSCLTEKDVRTLFKGATFGNTDRSNFFDEKIPLIDSGYVTTNSTVRLNGIAELTLRISLFFKLRGLFGSIPQNSGQVGYFSAIHSATEGLFSIGGCHSTDDIDSAVLDEFIKYSLDTKKLNPNTVKYKISMFVELLEYYPNDVPSFLLPDQNILQFSKKYNELVEICKKEDSKRKLVASAKKTYPLSDLKTLMSDSIQYVSKYREEVLEVAQIIIKTKGMTVDKAYSYTFDFLKETDIIFTEPTLAEVQMQVKNANTKYLYDGKTHSGRSIKRKDGSTIKGTMNKVVDKLEGACITISLMLTGMRVGELTSLDRRLKITQDEHLNFERIVYKTAGDSSGEPLSMPIPLIGKQALETLSLLATIKDGESGGNLVLTSIYSGEAKNVRTSRVNNLLDRLCRDSGVSQISPHQFRHAMAFLIVHIHENEGLELAKMFLGHTSITMTLQYMGHFNKELKEAIAELSEEESLTLTDSIVSEIQSNRKLFGEGGKRLMPSHHFTGQQTDEFTKLLRKGLVQLIKEKKLAILQTPVGMCIHDTSEPERLACQQGFDIKEIALNGVAPSRCSGASCSNSMFFESHMEDLKEKLYENVDPALRERLEQNTFFVEAGGFQQDPFRRLIREYDEYKNEDGVA